MLKPKKIKKGISYYLRFFISIALIYYVFRQAGLSKLWSVLRNTNLVFLGLSIAITPILIIISSWKWQVILRSQNIRLSLTRLFGLYMVGYFFNNILPTNVGGDVIRAYSLGKSTGKN